MISPNMYAYPNISIVIKLCQFGENIQGNASNIPLEIHIMHIKMADNWGKYFV